MISVTPRRQTYMQRAVVVLFRRDTEVGRWPFVTDRLDLADVDHLARLQLGARRKGFSIRLESVCPLLCGLLDLVGLRRELGA